MFARVPGLTVPLAIYPFSRVRTIATDGFADHSLALLENGMPRSWDDNDHGELGNGTRTESSTPESVVGLTDVRSIAGGVNDSLAITR